MATSSKQDLTIPLCKFNSMAIYPLDVEIFQSGPKWWTDHVDRWPILEARCYKIHCYQFDCTPPIISPSGACIVDYINMFITPLLARKELKLKRINQHLSGDK